MKNVFLVRMPSVADLVENLPIRISGLKNNQELNGIELHWHLSFISSNFSFEPFSSTIIQVQQAQQVLYCH